MMDANLISLIILCLFAVHAAWYGLGGGLLLTKHKETMHYARTIIGLNFCLLCIGCCVFILTALLRDTPLKFMKIILEPYPVIIAFVLLLTWVVYVYAKLNPHHFPIRKFLLLLSPYFILVTAFLIYHGIHGWQYSAITYLDAISKIPANLNQPDVILRLLLLGLYIPAGIITCFIPYHPNESLISTTWTWWLKILVLLCSLGLVFGMVLRITWVIVVYLVVLDIFSICVLKLEITDSK